MLQHQPVKKKKKDMSWAKAVYFFYSGQAEVGKLKLKLLLTLCHVCDSRDLTEGLSISLLRLTVTRANLKEPEKRVADL